MLPLTTALLAWVLVSVPVLAVQLRKSRGFRDRFGIVAIWAVVNSGPLAGFVMWLRHR